jgi:hypothetical protein
MHTISDEICPGFGWMLSPFPSREESGQHLGIWIVGLGLFNLVDAQSSVGEVWFGLVLAIFGETGNQMVWFLAAF